MRRTKDCATSKGVGITGVREVPRYMAVFRGGKSLKQVVLKTVVQGYVGKKISILRMVREERDHVFEVWLMERKWSRWL